MRQPFRGTVQQFRLAPAKRPGPGRVYGLPDTVEIGDHEQILRHVPDAVAFPGLFLDPFGQRGIQARELIGELAIFLLALPQRPLRFHLLGDIAVRADQADRLAVLVALDGGSHGNPAQLAVARTNDAVLHGIIAHAAANGIAKLLFGSFAIGRMDPAHPVFMAFVDRIRRQPMDQQIFRRAAIAEAGAQVALEPADPADLLHPRELGFALAQRRGGDMLAGDVAAHHQHAADTVVLVDRAVAIGPPDLLEPAVARHRHQLVLVPGRAAAAHHLLNLRADNGPDFFPAFAARLAQRARVPLRTHGLAIGVVIELDQLGTPPDEHRLVGIEQDAKRGPQALRPAVRRPDRR